MIVDPLKHVQKKFWGHSEPWFSIYMIFVFPFIKSVSDLGIFLLPYEVANKVPFG